MLACVFEIMLALFMICTEVTFECYETLLNKVECLALLFNMRECEELMVALFSTGRTTDMNSLTLPSYALFAMHYLLSSDNTVTHVAAFLRCRMHQKHKTSLELFFFFWL